MQAVTQTAQGAYAMDLSLGSCHCIPLAIGSWTEAIPLYITKLSQTIYAGADGNGNLSLDLSEAAAQLVQYLHPDGGNRLILDAEAVQVLLRILARTAEGGLSLGMEGQPVLEFQTGGAKSALGLALDPVSVLLVRKTRLADLDSKPLSDLDQQSLFDLTYTVVE